ncbi:hypothetical protein GCM10010505_02380 [Kitasatospora aburaviensis]
MLPGCPAGEAGANPALTRNGKRCPVPREPDRPGVPTSRQLAADCEGMAPRHACGPGAIARRRPRPEAKARHP